MSIRGGDTQKSPESATAESAQAMSKTTVFDVLKSDRRRAVIQYLYDHDGSASLSDVASAIAADENDTTVDRLTSQERKRVRIALYQCHLPRMDRMNVVDFDKNRGTIELRDQAEQVLSYMDLGSDEAEGVDPSDRLVFALAVGVAVLTTAGALGVGPLSAVPPSGWTMVSALALVGIAGEQWIHG